MMLPPSSYLVVANVCCQEIHLRLLSLVHLLRNIQSAIVSDIQGGLNTSKIAYWSDLEDDALVDYLQHTFGKVKDVKSV